MFAHVFRVLFNWIICFFLMFSFLVLAFSFNASDILTRTMYSPFHSQAVGTQLSASNKWDLVAIPSHLPYPLAGTTLREFYTVSESTHYI